MNWIGHISLWQTLLELKENHPWLGKKGRVFFASDFAQDLKSTDLKFILSTPTFAGTGVGKGIINFVLTQEELIELFTPIEKTFKQYAQELENDYFKQN